MEHLINLNFAPGGLPATVHVSQYDDTIRQLRFQLWFGRSKVEVPSGASVRVDIKKPDGHIVLVSGTVDSSDRSIVTVPTTKQMTAVPGGARGTLVVSSTGDKRISSAIFILQVHRDPVEDGDASASDLSMLQDAIDQTAANATAAQAAATAAQQAASSFTTDTTLSVSGKAADAKKTGDELTAIKADLDAYGDAIVDELEESVLKASDFTVKASNITYTYNSSEQSITLTKTSATQANYQSLSTPSSFLVGKLTVGRTYRLHYRADVLSGNPAIRMLVRNTSNNSLKTLIVEDGQDGFIDFEATSEMTNIAVFITFDTNVGACQIKYSDIYLCEVVGKTAIDASARNEISNVRAELSGITGVIPVTYENAYIALNGSTADIDSPVSQAEYVAYVVPCSEGDKFEISAVGGIAPRAYGFIDGESNVLLVANASVSVSNLILTAPADSAYLVINDKSGAEQYYGGSNTVRINSLEASSEVESIISGFRCVYIGLESGIYSGGNGKKANYNSVRTKHMLDRATVRYIKVDPSWRVGLYFYANPEIYQSTSSDAGYISNVSLTSYSGAVIDIEQVISDNNISGAVAYTVGFFKYANGAIDRSTAMTDADITVCYKNTFYAVSEDVSGIAFLNNKGIVAETGAQYYGEPRASTLLLKSSGYINIDPSKHNALRITMPTFKNNVSYGIAFYDKNDVVIGGKQIYGGQRNVYTKVIRIPENTKYFRTSYWMDTTTYGDFKCELINKDFSETVIVAASNSSEADKARADYVCTGTNDELILQSAINDSDHVYLCDGDYYIDSFDYEYPSGHFNAVCIGKPLATSSNVSYKQANVHIYGSNGSIRKAGTTIDFYGGANIHVSDDCYEALDANTQYSIFGGVTKNGVRIYPAASLKIENLSIFLPDNQKKIICIDGWNLARLSVNNIVCQAIHSGAGGAYGTGTITPADLHIPVDGCIGVRGTQGSNYGGGNIWKSCMCRGFYEGFAVSGEHVIGIDLGTRFCNYGYTFNRWTMEVAAQYAHPITMINCYSELDFNYPYFRSQWHINAAAGTYSRQTINIIDFNMEVLPEYLALGGDYAKESTPGTVFGEISYTAITRYSTTPNSVSVQFWESGHGHNVKTRNMAHAQSGTTAERNSYTPTYMQTYFDTTLNKLLIYDGTAWVDSNGNVVN